MSIVVLGHHPDRREGFPPVVHVFGLRHSPELTRRPGWAGDDNALPTYGLRTKVRCVEWATLTEYKWVNSGDRRGVRPWGSRPGEEVARVQAREFVNHGRYEARAS